MPHISRKKLTRDESDKIFKNFILAVRKFGLSDSFDNFYLEFLTPTEKIMFSKRLAAIILLVQGASTYTVWNVLEISPSTAYRIERDLEKGKYKHITNAFKKKESKFWELIEGLLDLLELPPYHVSREEFIRKKFKKHK